MAYHEGSDGAIEETDEDIDGRLDKMSHEGIGDEAGYDYEGESKDILGIILEGLQKFRVEDSISQQSQSKKMKQLYLRSSLLSALERGFVRTLDLLLQHSLDVKSL